MTNVMKRSFFLLEVISSLFILLFAYTGVSKLIDQLNFQYDIERNFPFLIGYSIYFSLGVPILELAIAILLIVPRLKRFGLWSALFLMLFFTGYVGFILSFSRDIPCTCGGVLRKMSWNQHLWFNIFFTILAGVGLYVMRRKSRSDTTRKVVSFS